VRIVGVIDVQQGRAVHARGGHRAAYEPVRRSGEAAVAGDPVALASAYAAAGVRELYVADLDAIGGAPPQLAVVERLAGANLPVMLDAGVTSVAAAEAAAVIARQVVVGLETLSSWPALEAIAARIGRPRLVFSLDLRGGVPIGPLVAGDTGTAPALAAHAVAAGAGTVLIIDLAHVGLSAGPDLERLREIRAAIPGVPLLAGGGVRDAGDLARLADCGCDGALVATALHEGRLRGPA
jgi:phosphoribosylformimino-5-aminoimidazole carboxamide ribotide isomerase